MPFNGSCLCGLVKVEVEGEGVRAIVRDGFIVSCGCGVVGGWRECKLMVSERIVKKM